MSNTLEQPAGDGYTIQRQATETSLLRRLALHTDLIECDENGSIAVLDYIETPYTEHGIVDKQTLIRRLLGSVASEYHWEGSFKGPHHIMWPRRAYHSLGVYTARAETTARFRESPSLKVVLPRELHDYLHQITEIPNMPDLDVMEQYILEQDQVSKLYAIVRHGSLSSMSLSPEEKELFRHSILLDKLGRMEDGQVGLMPDRKMLAQVSLAESRQILRHRARPLGISARLACQQVFFNNSLTDTPMLVDT